MNWSLSLARCTLGHNRHPPLPPRTQLCVSAVRRSNVRVHEIELREHNKYDTATATVLLLLLLLLWAAIVVHANATRCHDYILIWQLYDNI